MRPRSQAPDGSLPQALGIAAWCMATAFGLRVAAEVAARALPDHGTAAVVACLAILAPCALWLTRRTA